MSATRRASPESIAKHMTKIGYIRIATYVILILSYFVWRERHTYLPIDFPGDIFEGDRLFFGIPRWTGPAAEFAAPRRSIPEVLILAEKMLRIRVSEVCAAPKVIDVTVRKSEGRLIWVVTYCEGEDWPIGIGIDDITGLPVGDTKKPEPNQSTEATEGKHPPSNQSQAPAVPLL
jgi:hypothetical protein